MHNSRAKSYLRRAASEPYHHLQRRSNMQTVLPQPPHLAMPGGLKAGPGHCGARQSASFVNAQSEVGDDEGGERSRHAYRFLTSGSHDGEEEEELGISVAQSVEALQNLLFTQLNLLLITSPLGVVAYFYEWGDMPVFWLNFVSLIPLAALLGNATEELGLHLGDLIGGLLNATFGNAVEMIMTVQSLQRGLLTVVQGSLLGSILSNLLLVLGMSFFCGGLVHKNQKFNKEGATYSTSLLLLASMGIITPTVAAHHGNAPRVSVSNDILMISRCTALLIAGTYCLFLVFQLYTHLDLFKGVAPSEDDMVPEDIPSMSLVFAWSLTAVITVIISLNSGFLVGSIEGVVRSRGIPEGFIGVILLPIVGNAAEHMTAVTVAVKNKVDLTMGVAVGSSTQIAMFMVPFAVLVGWTMDKPMTLAFNGVSVAVLLLAILIVIGVVQDGVSNWFEGAMLMAAYLIVAIVFWFDHTMSSDFASSGKAVVDSLVSATVTTTTTALGAAAPAVGT
eukprot:Selendium_serpulae@DN6119_c0_g1_i3.p1